MLSVSILRDNLGKGSEMQYVKYAEHKEGPGNKEKPTSLQEALSLTGYLAQLWRPVFQSKKLSQDYWHAVQLQQLPEEGSLTWFPWESGCSRRGVNQGAKSASERPALTVPLRGRPRWENNAKYGVGDTSSTLVTAVKLAREENWKQSECAMRNMAKEIMMYVEYYACFHWKR